MAAAQHGALIFLIASARTATARQGAAPRGKLPSGTLGQSFASSWMRHQRARERIGSWRGRWLVSVRPAPRS
jgi:hypothetical protein